MGLRLRTRRLPALPRPKLVDNGRYVKLPREEYEAMKESLELLSTPGVMHRLARAREDIRKGRTISLEELKRRWKI